MSLEAVVVSGYAKGISYRPGDGFSQTNHAWNAVKINGEWKLFDVTWAAGYGKGVNGRLVTVMRFDDYWFNTRPDEFIFSHLPEDERWQLNQQKVSLSQYERIPDASAPFFKIGFNGSQCFLALINGTVRNIPVSYTVNGDIRMISMPFDRNIPSGKSIKVRIRSGNAVKIGYCNNGRITDLSKSGDEFSGVITTTPGQLSLMASFGDDSMTYHTFLEYVVE